MTTRNHIKPLNLRTSSLFSTLITLATLDTLATLATLVNVLTVFTALTLLLPLTPAQAAPINTYEYDATGNPTKTTDNLNHSHTQQYDSLNRLIVQKQAHPSTANTQQGQINTQYNALDNITQITDPRNLSTTYTKNAFGNILSQTSPDTGTTSYTYDNAGNLNTSTDADGRTASYQYDATNRVSSVTYSQGGVGSNTDETIHYLYDAGTNGQGHLTGLLDSTGGSAWSYDSLGRVVRKQALIGGQFVDVQQQYDSTGRLSRMIYPSTHYIDYRYNANGQINQLSVDGIIMLSDIQYHPTGLIKSYRWGNQNGNTPNNNTQNTPTYQSSLDSSGRLIQYRLGDALQNITYDAAGRITQLHRSQPTSANPTNSTPINNSISTFSYDNLNRLTSHGTASTTQSYSYDLNGNRTQLSISGNSYPYSIANTSNRLNNEAGPAPAKSYTYDASGHPTSNGQDTYTYYNSGRLKQINRAGTPIGILTYNGLGQLVIRNYNTGYLYDDNGHLLGEYNQTGDLTQETIWLGDTPILTLRPDSGQSTVDNNTSTITGNWTSQTTGYGYYGANYLSHPSTANSNDSITYSLTPSSAQLYRVYARWVQAPTNASNAIYTLNPNTPGSTPHNVMVDQTQSGGAWNYLGSYTLNPSSPLTVKLSAQGNGTVVADAIRLIPASPPSIQSISYLVQTDHLNTPRLIRNYSQQTRWTWYAEQAEAFGANLPDDNPTNTVGGQLGVFQYNLRFPGQIFDPVSQLSYNYFRDYNPRTGRFPESDPIGLAGGINTYGYVEGNPLSYVDPEGLASSSRPYIPRMNPLRNPEFHPAISDLPDSASGDCPNIIFGCPFDGPLIPEPEQCGVTCPNPNQCDAKPLVGVPALGYPTGCVLACGPRYKKWLK